jgi:hypothetical protein
MVDKLFRRPAWHGDGMTIQVMIPRPVKKGERLTIERDEYRVTKAVLVQGSSLYDVTMELCEAPGKAEEAD